MKKYFDPENSPKLNISLLKEQYHFQAELVSFQAELVSFQAEQVKFILPLLQAQACKLTGSIISSNHAHNMLQKNNFTLPPIGVA